MNLVGCVGFATINDRTANMQTAGDAAFAFLSFFFGRLRK
jgi:hypothetical protein